MLVRAGGWGCRGMCSVCLYACVLVCLCVHLGSKGGIFCVAFDSLF